MSFILANSFIQLVGIFSNPYKSPARPLVTAAVVSESGPDEKKFWVYGWVKMNLPRYR